MVLQIQWLDFLIQWYSQQCLQIQWRSTLSSFTVANGVWQVGILSPILFAVYSNCWVLAQSVIGKVCWVAYAMQMILLYLHLQLMYLEECWRYALICCRKEFGVQCQRDSIDTCFCRHKTIVVDDSIEFCEQKFCFSDSVNHLGHILSCNLSDSADIENKTKEYIRCAICLQLNLGMCSPIVSTRIILYVILYCCAPEDGLSWLHSLEIAVHKFLRHIWFFPYISWLKGLHVWRVFTIWCIIDARRGPPLYLYVQSFCGAESVSSWL